MADLDLNELISVEHREAFAAMWPKEKDAAEAEIRRLLDWVSNPDKHRSDTQNLVRRIFLGLLGEVPDLNTWLQAVAAGSLRLRPDQRYVIMRDGEKPARFIERGLKTYDAGVSARQRWAGLTDEGVHEGMHLIAFLILAKELKNLAAGPAALGPAWPLMVAIDSYLTNEEKRALHAAGSNEELQRALADAVKTAVGAYVPARDPKSNPAGRSAGWRRELPPGTDANAYFQTKKAAAESQRSYVDGNDPRQVEEMILRGPRPSFLPESPGESSAEIPSNLRVLLAPGTADLRSNSFRALARRDAREATVRLRMPAVQTDDFKIQVWLSDWARRGGGVTLDFPAVYFSYLVEEICLAYAADYLWDGTQLWQAYGVLPDAISSFYPGGSWSWLKWEVSWTWVNR